MPTLPPPVRLLFALLALCTAHVGKAAGAPIQLVSKAAGSRPTWMSSDPAELRGRIISFDIEALNALVSRLTLKHEAESVVISLFDDLTVTVQIDKIESACPDRFVVYGSIGGSPEGTNKGTALISVAGDAAVGRLVMADGRQFRLQYAGDFHFVSELDQTKMSVGCPGALLPPEGAALPIKSGKEQLEQPISAASSIKTASVQWKSATVSDAAPASANDASGPVIDVMIVYTPAMLQAAGSTQAVEAQCQLAIADTNRAFANSQINARVQLVHTELMTNYIESTSISTELERLAAEHDGYLDEVFALRDQYHADIVHLFISNAPGPAGTKGIAEPYPGGFAVDKGYAPFRHELGHNLGCEHDRSEGTTAFPFSYAFGYHFLGSDGKFYRDIMSQGTLDFYSNPNIIYKDVPAGVLKGQSNGADNATAINNIAPIVASYRTNAVEPYLLSPVAVHKDSVYFSSVPPNGNGATFNDILSNNLREEITVSDFQLTDPSGAFSVTVQKPGSPPGNSFVLAGQSLDGDSVQVSVVFSPHDTKEAVAKLRFTITLSFGHLFREIALVGNNTAPMLQNISTRLRVGNDENVLIGGFILDGPSPRKVLIRATGPSLEKFGVSGFLADPELELYRGSDRIAQNDDWGNGFGFSELRFSNLEPLAVESVILTTLDSGSYTTIVRGHGGTTGVALVEIYDFGSSSSTKLLNISSRGEVTTGDNVMIAGFIIDSPSNFLPEVIVRAIGPSLARFGIVGALLDPTLELHDGHGTTIAANDNWRSDNAKELEASGLAPSNDAESAILAHLPVGNYTAIVRGVNQTTGVALVEVYKP